MTALQISPAQARRFLLAYHGLWPPYSLHGKSGILEYIRRVNCIQFDPLNIAGTNQELVLQARVSDFRPEMLKELLYDERALLDGWDKNMSIFPAEDWPYFERRRQGFRRLQDRNEGAIKEVLPQVRRALKERGPLSSIDLKIDETVDWWWAPTRLARAALESMYLWGELVVHHKINTRKVYDFTHNCLPAELLEIPDPNSSESDYHDWYIHRRTGSFGMVWNRSSEVWLLAAGLKVKERQAVLERLMAQDRVFEVHVDGIDVPFYVRTEDRPVFDQAMMDGNVSHQAAVIAPLDNLIWDRRLLKDLFGFDYRWEVYKPAAERQYGYYVLPVLYGDRFIARFEPGKDKKNNALVIKNWWWEPDVDPAAVQADVQICLERFCKFLGVDDLQLQPPALQQVDFTLTPV